MIYSDLSLFPIHVRKTNLKECIDLEKLEQKSIKFLQENVIQKHGSLDFGKSTHNYTFSILDHLDETHVKEIILTEVNAFYNERFDKYRKLKSNNNWINLTEPGGKLLYHTHPTSVISVAFYISAESPNADLIFSSPDSTAIAIYGEQFYNVPVQTGDLIMFSSYIPHFSDETKTRRLVLSLNTVYDV